MVGVWAAEVVSVGVVGEFMRLRWWRGVLGGGVNGEIAPSTRHPHWLTITGDKDTAYIFRLGGVVSPDELVSTVFTSLGCAGGLAGGGLVGGPLSMTSMGAKFALSSIGSLAAMVVPRRIMASAGATRKWCWVKLPPLQFGKRAYEECGVDAHSYPTTTNTTTANVNASSKQFSYRMNRGSTLIGADMTMRHAPAVIFFKYLN